MPDVKQVQSYRRGTLGWILDRTVQMHGLPLAQMPHLFAAQSLYNGPLDIRKRELSSCMGILLYLSIKANSFMSRAVEGRP
jgi:hypothetical protein